MYVCVLLLCQFMWKRQGEVNGDFGTLHPASVHSTIFVTLDPPRKGDQVRGSDLDYRSIHTAILIAHASSGSPCVLKFEHSLLYIASVLAVVTSQKLQYP